LDPKPHFHPSVVAVALDTCDALWSKRGLEYIAELEGGKTHEAYDKIKIYM